MEELIKLLLQHCNLTPLIKKGLIYRVNEDEGFTLENIKINNGTVSLIKPQNKVSKKINSNSDEWIDEYRMLFKAVNKNKTGKGGRSAVVIKMDKFIERTKYDKDLILRATKNYIGSLPASALYDDKSMASADYFISFTSNTGETASKLEYWCEKSMDTQTQDDESEVQKWG